MHRMQEEDVVVYSCSTLTKDGQITQEQTVDRDEEEPAQPPLEMLSFSLDKNTWIEGEAEQDGNDGTDGQWEVNRIEQQLESCSRQNVFQLGLI